MPGLFFFRPLNSLAAQGHEGKNLGCLTDALDGDRVVIRVKK